MIRLPGLALVYGLLLCPVASVMGSETDKLEGAWDDVTLTRELEHPGKRVTRPPMVLTMSGSVACWEQGGRTVRQSLFTTSQAGPYRAVDFVTVGEGTFCTTRALFTIEGDTLTIREGAIDPSTAIVS